MDKLGGRGICASKIHKILLCAKLRHPLEFNQQSIKPCQVVKVYIGRRIRVKARRKEWSKLIGRPDLAEPGIKSQSHVVCSLHFDKSDINNNPRLKPDVLPSRLLPDQPGTSSSTNSRDDSTETSTQTNKSYVHTLSMTTTKNNDVDLESKSVQASASDKDEVTQTTLGVSDAPRKRKLIDKIKALKNENKKLKLELEKIKKELLNK